MHSILLIARREYLEQVRGRAFKMTTIGLPAVFALIVGVSYLSSLGLGANRRVAVASNDPALAEQIRHNLLGDKQAKATVIVAAPATPQDRALLLSKVEDGTLDGLLSVETTPGKQPAATYTSQSAGDFITTGRIRSALNHALLDERLTTGGMNQVAADALVEGISITTYQAHKDGTVVRSSAEASFWKGYIMAILLSMTTMIYGMNVARSIIQEKTSRIFEVMLATARPSDMLAGKLIGVGAVGLTQIAIWVFAAVALAGTAFAAPLLSGQFAIHFSWAEGLLFPTYFVLGYLLYASLFAGLAASCETEQELQMYTPLAALPIWLSFSLIWLVINDPNSVWSIAASLFPATAPIIMMLRMGSQIPPAWQFVASIGIMALSIWIVLWISARLYRVGILMYGKRATIPEIFRWLRYS